MDQTANDIAEDATDNGGNRREREMANRSGICA
jgi:hypothetical protein